MSSGNPIRGERFATVDGIPVVWIHPESSDNSRRLALMLPGFTSTKEAVVPHLKDLAAAGLTAVSFDLWQHGSRGTETVQQLRERVWSNFRRHIWPIIGQTTIEVPRIVDWALSEFGLEPHVHMGGISLGGDIAIAAAGLDHRIARVATIMSTPDWLRPGMMLMTDPTKLADPGRPDSYAQYFYEGLNPLTHLSRYAHGPYMALECGAVDKRVPPDGAVRFEEAIKGMYPSTADRIRVTLHDGLGHESTGSTMLWAAARDWLVQTGATTT